MTDVIELVLLLAIITGFIWWGGKFVFLVSWCVHKIVVNVYLLKKKTKTPPGLERLLQLISGEVELKERRKRELMEGLYNILHEELRNSVKR